MRELISIVTSFGPHRVERQQACLASWQQYGCTVTAVQTTGETAILSPYFPGVQFVETDRVADLFDSPRHVRISALTDLIVDTPMLVINSDISISSSNFLGRWDNPEPASLRLGIRHNVNRGVPMKEKWGIDAFMITPELARILPDIGLAIGLPWWDYLIPWWAYHHNIKIETDHSRCFYHEWHKQHWSTEHHKRGAEIVQESFGITGLELSNFIQVLTDRQHLRVRRFR